MIDIRHASTDDLNAITDLETQCFPETEAATRESLEKRISTYPDHFWVLELDGRIISQINGMTTTEPQLHDEMYADANMHNEQGCWQMIFGVTTLPKYQKKGYASKLMQQVIYDCKKQGRKGIVLTCKDNLVPFYEKFGFIHEGKSMSTHGGVTWNQMRMLL